MALIYQIIAAKIANHKRLDRIPIPVIEEVTQIAIDILAALLPDEQTMKVIDHDYV